MHLTPKVETRHRKSCARSSDKHNFSHRKLPGFSPFPAEPYSHPCSHSSNKLAIYTNEVHLDGVARTHRIRLIGTGPSSGRY